MKRRTSRSAVVITMALSAGCAGASAPPASSTPTEPTPTEPTPTTNPPAPPGESMLAPGATLIFRHGECRIVDPDDPHVDPSAATPSVPPAPASWRSVPCPSGLLEPGRIERDPAGPCTFTAETCPPPVLATCNPPPPRRVPCDGPTADPSPGPVTRAADGTCWQHVNVQCPPPYQPPCRGTEPARDVTCPE